MTISTATISGTLVLPDDTALATIDRIEFTLTGFETEDATIVHEPVSADVDGSGDFSIDLWPNELGGRSTQYEVHVVVSMNSGQYERRISLGNISVPAATTYDLDDLLGVVASQLPATNAGAAASALLAKQWANEDEDTVVADGEYSAKHYAAKAGASATAAAGSASTASSAASTATGAASTAASKAGEASDHADAGAASAASAATSAGTATTKAGEASDDADAAAASAASAATSAGLALATTGLVDFITVAGLIADDTILGYSGDEKMLDVAYGDIIKANGFRYEVAALGSADYLVATAGGVLLYALPNGRGEIYTEQLGWVEGEDVAANITRLFSNWPSGAHTLRQNGDYELTGSQYSLPTAMKAWLADNYEALEHGEQATRSLLLRDYSTLTAAANGISADLNLRFDCPSGFKVGGLRIDDNVTVDPADLVSGGNGQAIFSSNAVAVGATIDRCRFDQKGGIAVDCNEAPYWRFTRNFAGQQKYLLRLSGACHRGLYEYNRGEMGFQLSGGQIFGDFIKTLPIANIGPRYCLVQHNYFLNQYRDGPDGTGGFGGWIFFDNDFDVPAAAIDVKLAYNGNSDDDVRELQYSGVMFVNNRCHGCGIIITDTFQEDLVGAPYDPDLLVRQFYAQGNQFFPIPGRDASGYFFKSSRGGFLSIGDTFHSFTGVDAGTWDASSGSFPSGAVKHSYYTVSTGGTVDGETFTSGEIVYALVDDAATDSYDGNWVNTGNEYPRISAVNPVKLTNDGVGDHMHNQGTWDASTGSFPSGGVPGDYWTVSVAGTVDGVEFKVGHYLVPLVSSASTSTYSGQWERRLGDPGPNENIQFKDMTWDARGGSLMQISTVSDFRVHFADLQTDGVSPIAITHCENVHISGRARGYKRPTGEVGVVDLISISGSNPSRDIYVEVDYRHKVGDGSQGAVCQVTGVVENLWIDGIVDGAAEVVEGQASGVLTDVNLGKRSSLQLKNLSTRIVTKAASATINGAWKGRVYNPDGSSWWNNEPELHDLTRLIDGHGPELTIQGGSVTASYGFHRLDTQADASSDDLDTIEDGAIGDELMVAIADNARAVVLKDGTGNLALTSGDVTLSSTTAQVTLRKHPDGDWHQV